MSRHEFVKGHTTNVMACKVCGKPKELHFDIPDNIKAFIKDNVAPPNNEHFEGMTAYVLSKHCDLPENVINALAICISYFIDKSIVEQRSSWMFRDILDMLKVFKVTKRELFIVEFDAWCEEFNKQR